MTPSRTNIDGNNLLFRLARLTRRWRQVLDLEIQSAGLTEASWRPLLHLHLLGDGTRQKDLAASLGIEGPSLVRILDNLIAKGLVERTECSKDRRAKRLRLTPEGLLSVEQIRETVAGLERELLGPFSESEISQLTGLVQRLDAAVDSVRRRER